MLLQASSGKKAQEKLGKYDFLTPNEVDEPESPRDADSQKPPPRDVIEPQQDVVVPPSFTIWIKTYALSAIKTSNNLCRFTDFAFVRRKVEQL